MRRNNWTKQVTIILAAICVALAGISAYSVALAQDWLLQVEGVTISQELYSYFLSRALIEAERDEDGMPLDMEALREDVRERAARFVAINSELHNRGVALTPLHKARVAERTSFLWRVYGNYYMARGISKEVLALGQTGLAAWDQLFLALYDTGGAREVPEEDIEEFFYDNFVAFEGIWLFFTVTEADGTEREMTITERDNLLEAVRALAAQVNADDGPSFFEAAQDDDFAGMINYAVPSFYVIERDAHFEQIRGLNTEQVSVLTFDESLIIGRGIDMRESPEEYFYVYRTESLRALMGEEFERLLEEELFAHFRADENVAAVEALLGRWEFGR